MLGILNALYLKCLSAFIMREWIFQPLDLPFRLAWDYSLLAKRPAWEAQKERGQRSLGVPPRRVRGDDCASANVDYGDGQAQGCWDSGDCCRSQLEEAVWARKVSGKGEFVSFCLPHVLGNHQFTPNNLENHNFFPNLGWICKVLWAQGLGDRRGMNSRIGFQIKICLDHELLISLFME